MSIDVCQRDTKKGDLDFLARNSITWIRRIRIKRKATFERLPQLQPHWLQYPQRRVDVCVSDTADGRVLITRWWYSPLLHYDSLTVKYRWSGVKYAHLLVGYTKLDFWVQSTIRVALLFQSREKIAYNVIFYLSVRLMSVSYVFNWLNLNAWDRKTCTRLIKLLTVEDLIG